MKVEEEDVKNQNKLNLLYPAIVQDTAELIMNIVVPTKRSLSYTSSKDLLEGLELPDWTTPLLNVSNYLHFLRGDTKMPDKLFEEVFKLTTKTHNKHQLDNVVVVRKVPNMHARYTCTWIIERVIKLLTKH